MPYRLFKRVLKNKDVTEQFKIVSYLFIGALVVLILTVGYFLFDSSQQSIKKSDNAAESAQIACEAVQDNNQILRNYLFETEDRAIQRINQEKIEGKVPLYDAQEIKESYKPLIDSLARKSCTEGNENGGKR